MQVIVKQPGQDATIEQIENSLKALQETVGGYIETFKLAPNLIGIVDEEGRLKNAAPNVFSLVGTIVFCAVKGEEFDGLTDLQARNLMTLLNGAGN